MARVKLECFERTDGAEAPPSADYLRGLEDGLAKATASGAAECQKALESVAVTLGDMAFGYAEARTHILGQIRPVIAQITDMVLPAIAQEAFAGHLTDVLANAIDATAREKVKISVAPDALADLQGSIAANSETFSFVADDSLVSGQALLRGDSTHILIDFPALLDALRTALLGFETPERTQSHG